MSELTEYIRENFPDDETTDPKLFLLCDENERLKAEHEKLRGEYAMALAERDAFCSMVTQATRELDRLEGLLRAWGAGGGDHRRVAVYSEAVRLAKESE